MNELNILYYIRDEMLSNPDIIASDVYDITNIAEKDAVMYVLLSKWMEQVDVLEKNKLFQDMLYRRKQLDNIIPFPKRFNKTNEAG